MEPYLSGPSARLPWRVGGSAIRRWSCCWRRTDRPRTQLGREALGREEEHPDTGGLRSAQEQCPLEGRIFSLMSGSFFVDILAEQRELVGGATRREHLEGSLLSYPSVPFTRVSTEGIVDKYRFG